MYKIFYYEIRYKIFGLKKDFKKGVSMKTLFLKILTTNGLFFLLISTSNSTNAMISPKEVLAVYQAMISTMPDSVLVQRYQEEFDRLRKTFNDTTKNLGVGSDATSQLPIFKVAIFKSIINEIKKRQEQTRKMLLSPDKIIAADQLIREKEGAFKAGIAQEREPKHK